MYLQVVGSQLDVSTKFLARVQHNHGGVQQGRCIFIAHLPLSSFAHSGDAGGSGGPPGQGAGATHGSEEPIGSAQLSSKKTKRRAILELTENVLHCGNKSRTLMGRYV
jgi:hypothetical protein